MGDDLRRVHWPSTARRDELTVRQDERHQQGRTTVLLDVRRAVHTDVSFERAVSAAASLLVAATVRGDEVRLVATDGTDSGYGGFLWIFVERGRVGAGFFPGIEPG